MDDFDVVVHRAPKQGELFPGCAVRSWVIMRNDFPVGIFKGIECEAIAAAKSQVGGPNLWLCCVREFENEQDV